MSQWAQSGLSLDDFLGDELLHHFLGGCIGGFIDEDLVRGVDLWSPGLSRWRVTVGASETQSNVESRRNRILCVHHGQGQRDCAEWDNLDLCGRFRCLAVFDKVTNLEGD